MSRLLRLAFVMATLGVGCGRVGVRLLPEPSDAGAFEAALDAASDTQDAGRLPSDAAIPAWDASSIPRADAAIPRDAMMPMDASPATDASQGADAQADGATDAGRTLPCAGDVLFDICWYLAPADTSCNSACASHGGYDGNASRHVGTTEQGGSAADCKAILNAVRGPGEVLAATRDDRSGLGCHVWSDGTYYWLDDPSPYVDPSFAAPAGSRVRIACGCQR